MKTCVFSIHRRIFSITETHLLLKRIFIRIFNRFFPFFLFLINNYGFFSNICINRIEPEENIKYFVRLTTLTGFPGFPVFPVFSGFSRFSDFSLFFPFNQLVGFTNTFNNLINQIFTRFSRFSRFPRFSDFSPCFRFNQLVGFTNTFLKLINRFLPGFSRFYPVFLSICSRFFGFFHKHIGLVFS